MRKLDKTQESGSGCNTNIIVDPLYQQFQRLKQEWESYKRRHYLLAYIQQLMISASSPTRLMSWLQHPSSPSPCHWMMNLNGRRRCDWAAREIVNERMDAIEGGRLKGIRRLFCDREEDVEVEEEEEEEEKTCITDITEWSDYPLSSVDSGSVVDGRLFISPTLSCIAKDNKVIEGLHEGMERESNSKEEEKMVMMVGFRHGVTRRWTLMKWITMALVVLAWMGITNVAFGVHWKWIDGKEVIQLVPT